LDHHHLKNGLRLRSVKRLTLQSVRKLKNALVRNVKTLWKPWRALLFAEECAVAEVAALCLEQVAVDLWVGLDNARNGKALY
jgi:hypothetical protein